MTRPSDPSTHTRREFLRSTSLAAGAVLLAGTADSQDAEEPKLPRRTLGRTGLEVSILSLGLGAAGDGDVDPGVVREIVNTAIDGGVNYIDDAPIYGNTEAIIGPVLAERRSEVYIAGKVEAQDKAGALAQLEKSRRDLQVDTLDVASLHNLGDFDPEQVAGPNGAFTALREAREAGHVRFLGVSGHNRPSCYAPFIRTGEVDVVMVPMNFVDRHTYDFESKVLPAAMEYDCGIICMKVLGGVPNWNYRNIGHPNLAEHYESCIRYALTLPGVASAVMGLCTVAETRQALDAVRTAQPLADEEFAALLTQGKELAPGLGPRFGPTG